MITKSRKAIAALAIIFIFFFSVCSATGEQRQSDEIVLPGGYVRLPGGEDSGELSHGGLMILKFAGEPDEELQDKLSARGILLRQYLGNNAYWARVAPGTSPAGGVGIRAAVRPEARYKIAPEVTRDVARSSVDREVTVVVSLFSGQCVEEFSLLLAGIGGRMEYPGMLYGDRAEVSLPASALEVLAASDAVIAIEPRLKEPRLLNSKAARCANIDDVRERLGLDGTGVAVGIWDAGKVYEHKEFAGRLVNTENGYVDAHSTHIAGTIGASGINPHAGGMAPNAILYAYNFNGDLPREMATARKKYGIILSNNSWGYGNGWELDDVWYWYGTDGFGLYSSESAAYDKLVYETGLIVVFAAGNDRGDIGTRGKYYDMETRSFQNSPPHDSDGPYHSIGEMSSAKNIIAVGAVKTDGRMSGFSSWGPTDDGRIKPEITADGVGLYSTLPYNRYGKSTGTSMAAPAVTGGLALVAQNWQDILGGEITPDAVRALLAATARDRGPNGPDYQYGFGLLNVQAMVELIGRSIDDGTIRQDEVSKGDRRDAFELAIPEGTKSVKVALAWIDPPAVPRAAVTLVNDLDIRLVSPAERIYQPWRLGGSNPSAPATRGVNRVDNIELVELKNPKPGIWHIEVTASNFGSGNKQTYTIAVGSSASVKLR